MSKASIKKSKKPRHVKPNTSYYLSRIEVYNWGAFSGFHEADINEAGTAVIGQTGSGKTTLIDALLTLLVQYPRYNFASTGGHESDRSLMSYIRGIAGSGEGLERVARGGKTVTALTAYFSECTPLSSNDSNIGSSTDSSSSVSKDATQPDHDGVNSEQGDLFNVLDDSPDTDNSVDTDKDTNNSNSNSNSNSNTNFDSVPDVTDTPDINTDTVINTNIELKHPSPAKIAIGGLFWLDSSSNSTGDRKNVWLVAKSDDDVADAVLTTNSQSNYQQVSGLKEWVTQFADGGKRGLKAWARSEGNISVYDSKSAYLSKVRQLFEVNEQAFTLLGRAVGLKQLNSVNEIFRDLVLEDNSSFERASEVIAQFDDLTAIKATLETAERQRDSLTPLATLAKKLDVSHEQITTLEQMHEALPVWFAHHGKALWQQRITTLENSLEQLQHMQGKLEKELNNKQGQLNAVNERYRAQGGDKIDWLKNRIRELSNKIKQTESNRNDYIKLCTQLGLDTANTADDFDDQKQLIKRLTQELTQQQNEVQDEINRIGAEKFKLTETEQQLEEEFNTAKSQRSNIPPHFEKFRHELAEQLKVDRSDLPYVAQLVEVKAEESAWRGAIERALGTHRLRLLVPQDLMRDALQWVNTRNNQLHVRLYSADDTASKPMPDFFADGYLRKFNYRSHPLRDALKHMLSKLDRHCVADTQALEQTPHAMTKQGLMSNQTGWYDKQDQKSLTANWLTGFDNQDLIKRLQHKISELNEQLTHIDNQYQQLFTKQKKLTEQEKLLGYIADLDYATIDVTSDKQQHAQLQERLAILTAPDSDLTKLEEQINTMSQDIQRIEKSLQNTKVDIGIKENKHHTAQNKLKKLLNAIQTAPQALQVSDASILQTLNKKMHSLIDTTVDKELVTVLINNQSKNNIPNDNTINEVLDDLPQLEKQATRKLSEQLHAERDKKTDIEKKIIRQMGRAKQEDTGELSEVHTELSDLSAYLDRLLFLQEEDLPSKQERFLNYLNESSKSSITQLLTDVTDEVDKINLRIDALNRIMYKVDFEADKYLRLNATPVIHTSLRALDSAQKRLTAVTLSLVDDGGDAHYRALLDVILQLQDAVDKKHTLSAKALLDPRHRLTFSVSVMSREDDRELEARTGSQGGSGGEKEIIASHILTASLSYALNPHDLPLPKFATIVLDEAFSKSSPQVATRIVDAIREFGLHPLFVTPNKEMRLLRAHTKSAVLVVRKGANAVLSNWSWQQLSDKSAEKLSAQSIPIDRSSVEQSSIGQSLGTPL